MMPEQVRQQIDRWFDGELTEAEQDQLRQTLETLPEALEYFSDRGLLHQMLAETSAFSGPAAVLPEPGATRRTLLWAASFAAGCLALCCLLLLPPAVASPAELVRRTLAEFQSTVDRCYTVSVESGAGLRRTGFRRQLRLTDSMLWVRGNRFTQTFAANDGQLIWGRNSRGAVWFSMSGKSAAVFEPDEVPKPLADACELRTLQLPTLLETLLRDYDLEYSSSDSRTNRILAKPRSATASAKYGSIEIDIDPQSLLVQRVTLERFSDQRLMAVVSFSLVEVKSRDESLYELTGNLQPTATVLDRHARIGSRSELLRVFLQRIRAPRPESPSR